MLGANLFQKPGNESVWRENGNAKVIVARLPTSAQYLRHCGCRQFYDFLLPTHLSRLTGSGGSKMDGEGTSLSLIQFVYS